MTRRPPSDAGRHPSAHAPTSARAGEAAAPRRAAPEGAGVIRAFVDALHALEEGRPPAPGASPARSPRRGRP